MFIKFNFNWKKKIIIYCLINIISNLKNYFEIKLLILMKSSIKLYQNFQKIFNLY